MRKVFAATSALFLLSAGASFAQDLPDELAGNQGVDATVTTGSIGPLEPLTRGNHLDDLFKPSDEDNLPYTMREGDIFDNDIDPGTSVADSPVLRPLAGQETETFSARDENLPPEDNMTPGG